MKVEVICSENIEKILKELLSSRNIIVDAASSVCFVERGLEIPQNKLAIVFELSSLNLLIDHIDQLAKTNEDSNEAIIGKSSSERYEVIPIKQVYYFEGRGNYVYCVTLSGEYRVKEKLYELEAKLPQNRFIRVSKSCIVNISNVKEIIPWFGRRLVLRFNNSKLEVEVSKSQVKSFKEFLDM